MSTTRATVSPPPRPGGGGMTTMPASTPLPGYERGPTAPSTSDPGAGLHIKGASTLYVLLGLALLAAAILALTAPYRLSDVFFRGNFKHADVLYEELWRILAAVFLMASVVCFSLRVASDARLLDHPAVQRLQLGLFWFALSAVLLHLVHLLFVKSLTLWGLLLGALIMGTTVMLPTAHLTMSGGFGLADMQQGWMVCLANLFAPRQLSLATVLYSLLTVLFTLVGVTYIIIPKITLNWVFGYSAGKASVFLWQWIGSGMVFLFPAVTYTCEEQAIMGLLDRTIPKSLNVGLAVAGLFHILELMTLLLSVGVTEKRWLLPVVVVHWFLVLVAALLGLSAGPPPPAAVAAEEYEPLVAEGATEEAAV